jgi:plasmid stabilization system protein ParE
VRLLWSRRSVADLRALRAFIEHDNPDAAARVVERIIDVIETMVPGSPQIGRPGVNREHANLSSAERLTSSRIEFVTAISLSCASSMALGAGRIGYEASRRASAKG